MNKARYLQARVRAGMIVILFSCFFCVLTTAFAFPNGTLAHDQERLGPTRLAGLRSDRTQIPALIAIVQEKPTSSRFIMETALHSLAQLGAIDALPAIDHLIQSHKDDAGNLIVDLNVVNAAKAARARLIAEAAGGTENGTIGQAQLKLAHFYSELGETPAQINVAMSSYISESSREIVPDQSPKYPVELYAVRELADMAYHSPQREFAALKGVSEIDFGMDKRSYLKAHLAPLTQGNRLAWLIQDLSQKKTLSEDDFAEIQLAGDFGPEAGKLAADKLREMDKQTSEPPRASFDALFGVVTMSGDDEKEMWEHFKHHSNPYIAEYARRGGAREFIAAY